MSLLRILAVGSLIRAMTTNIVRNDMPPVVAFFYGLLFNDPRNSQYVPLVLRQKF